MIHLTKKAAIVFGLSFFFMIGCVTSAIADENETSTTCQSQQQAEKTA